MDLRNVPNAITDFFVICSGTSDTQLDAIAKSVEETVSNTVKKGAKKLDSFVNNAAKKKEVQTVKTVVKKDIV